MVVTETFKQGDRTLIRHYSDSDRMIRKDASDELYCEAVDTEESGFTYTETDIPVEDNGEITLEDALAMLGELGVETDDH